MKNLEKIDWLIGKSVLRSVGDTSANNGGKGKDLYLAALNMLSPFSWEISIKNSEEIKIHIFNFGFCWRFYWRTTWMSHTCLTSNPDNPFIFIFIKLFADHKQGINNSCHFNIAHRVSRIVSKFLISLHTKLSTASKESWIGEEYCSV